MLNRTGVIFCSVSLVVAVGVSVGGYQFAALPRAALAAAKAPVSPEAVPELDLPGVGKMTVLDLMGYYIDNPPASANAAGAVAAPKRFGGC